MTSSLLGLNIRNLSTFSKTLFFTQSEEPSFLPYKKKTAHFTNQFISDWEGKRQPNDSNHALNFSMLLLLPHLRTIFNLLRHKILTAASMNMAVFWIVAPCSMVVVHRRHRDAC
jgi:hypothetical protein